MTPEEIEALYNAAPGPGSGSNLDAEIERLYNEAPAEPWNILGAVKSLGAGAIEGLVGTGALVQDVLDPAQRMLRYVESRPKSTAEMLFPNSVRATEEMAGILPEADPTYRYFRKAGQFMGPGALAKAPIRAALSEIPAAIGAQAAEDATGETVLAPLAGAIGAKGLTSFFGGLFGAAKPALMGASADEIKGSAAKAFKEQTALTPAEIDAALLAQRADPLLQYKTTAELTGNAGAAQIEKTLATADEPARIYQAHGAAREAARDALIDQMAPPATVTGEGLGTRLIEAAARRSEEMADTAQGRWSAVPRYEAVDVTAQRDGIAAMLSTKQGGLPVDRRVMTLVEQFTEAPLQTSGRLQDIRSSALELGRDANIRPSDQRVLNALQANIDEAVREGGDGQLYTAWRAARDATASRAETFRRGTAGGALTEEMARPSNVFGNANKGDRRSMQELAAAIGGDADLLGQVDRELLNRIPRDVQDRITPAGMKRFLSSNEGALVERLGQQHVDNLGRVLEDLQSEARVQDMAFRASKGNSVTSQRQTVAGAVQDAILSASTKDAPGVVAKIINQLKEGAGIRDKLAVRDLLFRASMDPQFARELAATPTRTRILNIFERLGRIASAAGEGAAKSAGVEIGSSTSLPKGREGSEAEKGLPKNETKGSLSPIRPTEPSQALNTREKAPRTLSLFKSKSDATQANSLQTLAFLDRLFGGGNDKTASYLPSALFGSKKNDMNPKYETVVAKVMPALFEAESGGDPNAVSKAGAKGLGQLLDGTGREWHKRLGLPGKYDPFNAEQNAKIATEYYAWLLEQFKGDAKLALAAYNHGIGNVKDKMARWGKDFKSIYPRLPAETQAYVKRITRDADIA